ncbi:helix-turn-helix transcriptional regulator [Streptacidiphilus monticola]|uniref:LuxR C-terminal-related transcriptional regulator n=1 Tax=Streptacidiphilus monticola TaxID=2161674 RepID=A0ABW1G8R7_9ACTN
MSILGSGNAEAAYVAKETALPEAEVERCIRDLAAHHLLTPSSAHVGGYLAVSPDLAAARLVEPLEAAIRSYRDSADTIRERLLQLLPAYLSRQGSDSVAVSRALEVIADPKDVQLLINQAVNTCTKELMTVQPGGQRDPEALKKVLPQELAAINRGVRMRVLYQHTTRSLLGVRAYVSAITEAGAQVRTADQLAERMLIFDREVVFIPKWQVPGQVPGAVMVREPVLVAFLCALFDQFWSSATPFVPEGPGYQDASDDLQRSIVQLLAQGLKDELVARRLGMSVRTCRRHIAAIMRELGADSRFEAGVKAAQLGWLERSAPTGMEGKMSMGGN